MRKRLFISGALGIGVFWLPIIAEASQTPPIDHIKYNYHDLEIHVNEDNRYVLQEPIKIDLPYEGDDYRFTIEERSGKLKSEQKTYGMYQYNQEKHTLTLTFDPNKISNRVDATFHIPAYFETTLFNEKTIKCNWGQNLPTTLTVPKAEYSLKQTHDVSTDEASLPYEVSTFINESDLAPQSTLYVKGEAQKGQVTMTKPLTAEISLMSADGKIKEGSQHIYRADELQRIGTLVSANNSWKFIVNNKAISNQLGARDLVYRPHLTLTSTLTGEQANQHKEKLEVETTAEYYPKQGMTFIWDTATNWLMASLPEDDHHDQGQQEPQPPSGNANKDEGMIPNIPKPSDPHPSTPEIPEIPEIPKDPSQPMKPTKPFKPVQPTTSSNSSSEEKQEGKQGDEKSNEPSTHRVDGQSGEETKQDQTSDTTSSDEEGTTPQPKVSKTPVAMPSTRLSEKETRVSYGKRSRPVIHQQVTRMKTSNHVPTQQEESAVDEPLSTWHVPEVVANHEATTLLPPVEETSKPLALPAPVISDPMRVASPKEWSEAKKAKAKPVIKTDKEAFSEWLDDLKKVKPHKTTPHTKQNKKELFATFKTREGKKAVVKGGVIIGVTLSSMGAVCMAPRRVKIKKGL